MAEGAPENDEENIDLPHRLTEEVKDAVSTLSEDDPPEAVRQLLESPQGQAVFQQGASILYQDAAAAELQDLLRRLSPALPGGYVIEGVSRRGYSGHSMLGRMGLIHMNGRVYDPLIGRFLSADPHIQHTQPTSGTTRFVGRLKLMVLSPAIGLRRRFDTALGPAQRIVQQVTPPFARHDVQIC